MIPLTPIQRTLAATLHVPADHSTIQSCIDAATNGDECVVAPGTYNELINFLGKAITLRSSHGPEATTIDGGDLDGSVVQITNQTGEPVFSGFTVIGGNGSLINGIRWGGGMYISAANPSISNSVFLSNDAEFGGGIYNTGSPTIRNCQFLGNHAKNGGGIFNSTDSETEIFDSTFQGNVAFQQGAGIYNQQSRHRIERCVFHLNQALVGGGMRNLYSTVDVVDCDFEDNTAYESGAGLANGESPDSIVQFGNSSLHSTFDLYTVTGGSFRANESYENDPSHGGGAIYDNALATTLTGVTFENNIASGSGGAVLSLSQYLTVRQCSFVANGAGHKGGALLGGGDVDHCFFEANSSTFGNGGAIAARPNHEWRITNSEFIGNSAGSGGATYGPGEIRHCTFLYNKAIYAGGAVHSPTILSHSYLAGNEVTLTGGAVYTDRPTRLLNSVLVGNEANSGGAIFNDLSLSVFNCTLVNNFARDFGGAIANQQSDKTAHSLSVSNTIIHENTASVDGHQIWSGPEPFDTTIFFSNIQGSGGSENWDASIGLDAGGNLDVVPEFVRVPDDGLDGWGDDPATFGFDESLNDDFGDLRLQPGSPCINAGDPAYPFIAGDSDLDGHPRVLCGRIDMGAYEFGIGDYDCDQSITLADLSALPDCMTDPELSAFQSQIKTAIASLGSAWVGDREISTATAKERGWLKDMASAQSNASAIERRSRQSQIANRQFESSCSSFDFDTDSDVDLLDFAEFQNLFDTTKP